MRRQNKLPLSILTSNRDWLWGLILVLAVILAYLPVWHAGFIWDDDAHVTANPCIVGPLGLKQIWTTSAARICPLTLTSFWIEHKLWGLHPLPYHLVNVLVHGASAVLLWQVLRSLRMPGAWLGAALWALHPVQVESVAWITEMKNAQSGLFFLLTIFFFAEELKNGSERSYWLTLLFAAMAMASKSSTVVLPAVLCLCAWWLEGRWHWRNLERVAPIFLMSVAASAVSMWTQKLEGGLVSPEARSWPQRLATAGDVAWFYLGKLLWPHPLIFIYPRWKIDAGQWFSYLPLLCLLVLLLVLWSRRGSWGRGPFFALSYFLAVLLPVLGLVNHYFLRYSFVGDHFQYLASMGPLALAGAGLSRLANLVLFEKRWPQTVLCAGLMLTLGLLSWNRTWAYQNQETLWTDTLARNPGSWMAHNNLGAVFLHGGRVDESIVQFQKAIELNPAYAESYYNLGLAYFQKGQTDEAIVQYQKALKIGPRLAEAHNSLGLALMGNGQLAEAVVQFQKALEIHPYDAQAYYNLGLAFFQKGRPNQAIVQYQRAIALNPGYGDAYNNLGVALAKQGQWDEALAQFETAVRLNPGNVSAQDNLTRTIATVRQNLGGK